jgi:hypothetical protein
LRFAPQLTVPPPEEVAIVGVPVSGSALQMSQAEMTRPPIRKRLSRSISASRWSASSRWRRSTATACRISVRSRPVAVMVTKSGGDGGRAGAATAAAPAGARPGGAPLGGTWVQATAAPPAAASSATDGAGDREQQQGRGGGQHGHLPRLAGHADVPAEVVEGGVQRGHRARLDGATAGRAGDAGE